MNDIQETMVSIIIPLSFFATVFGIIYIILSARNRERMAMIEKGADPKIFSTKKMPGSVMRIALLLLGIGLGFVVGELLHKFAHLEEGLIHISSALLFGGIGLGIYYFLFYKKDLQIYKEMQEFEK